MELTGARALIRVLDLWHIQHIYGFPDSSVNGLLDGLCQERDKTSQHIKVIFTEEEIG